MSTPLRIPLASPDIGPAERAAVDRVLRSGWLSLGPELAGFEADMAAYHGVPEAVATSSGTAALHLALRAWDIGPGDEVITSPFSFIASANAMLYVGARPVFVDIDSHTLNLDPQGIANALSPRTKAILPVHIFGRPAAMDAIMAIAASHGLRVLEDACEAIGAESRGRKVGTIGTAGAFGFYPNKMMTTGEGGILLLRDPDMARRVRGLRNQGRDPAAGWADHVELGYNFRLPEIACALGRVQLARIEELMRGRARVAALYHERLAGDERLLLPGSDQPGEKTSWFVYVVRLAAVGKGTDRDAVWRGLLERGIGCGRYFAPIHLQPLYRDLGYPGPGSFPLAEQAGASSLALPFHAGLDAQQVDEVVAALQSLL